MTAAGLEDLSPEDKEVVLRLSTATDRMHTKAFSFAESGADCPVWLEAWKNPQSGLWRVEKFEQLGSGEQSLIQNDILLRASSLFEAVHECAAFETQKKTGGASEAATTPNGSYYHDVAEEAGIPFDDTGLPLPAAHGRILAEGRMFNNHALEVAARTARPLLRAKDRNAENVFFMNGLAGKEPAGGLVKADPAFAVERTALAKAGDINAKMKLMGDFEEAARAAEKVSTLMADRVKSYKGTLDVAKKLPMGLIKGLYHGIGIATLGTFYIYTTYSSKLGASSERHMRKQISKVEKAAARLPDGELKYMLNDFAKAASGIHLLERAAINHHWKRIEQASEEKLRKDLKTVNKAADAMGLSPQDKEKLQLVFARGEFPQPGYFSTKLPEQSRAIRETVNRLRNSL